MLLLILPPILITYGLMSVLGAFDSGDNNGPVTDFETLSPGDETYTGGSDHDEIYGSGGNDLLIGNDGKDVLRGEAGDDIILGGADNDQIGGRLNGTTADGTPTASGGEGTDLVNGGAGDDRVFEEAGDDIMIGREAIELVNRILPENERISLDKVQPKDVGAKLGEITPQQFIDFLKHPTNSDAGDDLLRGGDGNDTIMDVMGRNTLYGDLGNDMITSADLKLGEADTVFGGYGRDEIIADDGDVVSGGKQVDEFGVLVFETEADAVQITDWEAGEKIGIEIYSGQTGALDYSYNAATKSVLIKQGTQTLVDVRSTAGMTAADVARVRASVELAQPTA